MRIIISGYTDSQDIIAGINDAGIYQYVLKPWMPEHLLSTVARAAEARRLQMQTQRLNLELRTSAPAQWPAHPCHAGHCAGGLWL